MIILNIVSLQYGQEAFFLWKLKTLPNLVPAVHLDLDRLLLTVLPKFAKLSLGTRVQVMRLRGTEEEEERKK